jgi:signal transduction histidine kinase
MRSPQKIPTTNSIRLRLSLIAGVMLLVLLFSVYVGGRYIVVQMIHQTEAHMQTVGGDIQTPGSLAARASVALGWLTCFIAVVGIVFVIPIFWIHSKLILDPLDVLTRQIHEMRTSRMEGEQGVVASRDVTQAEERESESCGHVEAHLAKVQKMESLGTLAVGIAHDFNNILAIIQNTVELSGRQSDGEMDEAVKTIHQATKKGAALTRQLMTYAGHAPAEFECQDVNAMIRELEGLMSGVVAQNVILDFKLDSNLPPVAADPQQFWKVLINLLRNASEAFDGASGHITVSTSLLTLTRQISASFFSPRPLPLKRGVLIQVEDTGPGIHPDVIDRLFEPFVSTKAVGRGLGLATVFGIVGVHNGGIAIRSELGKGTCFRIWLPVFKQPRPVSGAADTQPDAAGDPQAVTVPRVKSDGSAARPLVLLVDDDPAILRTTSVVLRSLGIETLAASSQREAQTLFSRHADAISLLLLDAQAGNFDNVRLLSILRLSRPGLPAVILSGHAEERVRVMFASVRYDAFLGKPYTRDELKAVLQDFIALS